MNIKLNLDRFKEPSTWRGITVLLGILGVQLTPEFQGAILNIVGGIYFFIQFFRKEKK